MEPYTLGSVNFPGIVSARSTGWAVSTDGGASFSDNGAIPPTTPANTTQGDAGDPVMARDTGNGTIYLLTNPSRESSTWGGFRLWKSTDNGQSFTLINTAVPSVVTTADKPMIAVNNFSGLSTSGNLYAVGTASLNGTRGVTVARSANSGVTWIDVAGFEANSHGADLCIGPDGTVYVFYIVNTFVNSTNQVSLKYSWRRIVDGGWNGPLTISAHPDSTLLYSVNGGASGNPKRSNSAAADDYFVSNAFPRVAVNPINGRIYLVYADLPFPGSSTDRGDIFINEGVPQGDGSLNWTGVRKLNNDGTATDQWNPSVVINPVGTQIFIGYYSRQGDPSSNALIKAYGAKSNLTNGFATATFDVFPISATASFWRCPSDPSSSLFGGQRLPRVRSYSMNGYMDSTPGRIDMLDWKIFQQSTGIPVPSELFVMIDEREDTIVNGFFVVDMGNPRPLMYSAPRSAHNGGGVLGFADGHVIRKKWLDLAAWPCVSPRGLGAGHGTDHIDRIDGAPRDLGWLQEHTTVQ